MKFWLSFKLQYGYLLTRVSLFAIRLLSQWSKRNPFSSQVQFNQVPFSCTTGKTLISVHILQIIGEILHIVCEHYDEVMHQFHHYYSVCSNAIIAYKSVMLSLWAQERTNYSVQAPCTLISEKRQNVNRTIGRKFDLKQTWRFLLMRLSASFFKAKTQAFTLSFH